MPCLDDSQHYLLYVGLPSACLVWLAVAFAFSFKGKATRLLVTFTVSVALYAFAASMAPSVFTWDPERLWSALGGATVLLLLLVARMGQAILAIAVGVPTALLFVAQATAVNHWLKDSSHVQYPLWLGYVLVGAALVGAALVLRCLDKKIGVRKMLSGLCAALLSSLLLFVYLRVVVFERLRPDAPNPTLMCCAGGDPTHPETQEVPAPIDPWTGEPTGPPTTETVEVPDPPSCPLLFDDMPMNAALLALLVVQLGSLLYYSGTQRIRTSKLQLAVDPRHYSKANTEDTKA